MDDNRIIEILMDNESLLTVAKIWWDVLRGIAWAILRGVTSILEVLSSGKKQMLKLMNFYSSPEMIAFLAKYETVVWGIAGLSILFLMYKIASASSAEERSKIGSYFQNFLFSIILFFGLPFAMSTMTNLFVAGSSEIVNGKSESLALYQNNIVDFYVIDKNGWKDTDKKNNIKTMDNVKLLDITEVVDVDGSWFKASPLSSDGVEILSKRVKEVDGKKELAKMKSHWFTADDAYYRYGWSFGTMLLEAIIQAVVAAFILFKIAQFSLELGILNVFTGVTVFSDIANGQRTKQLFLKIRNIFIVLYCCLAMQTIYSIFCNYLVTIGLSTWLRLIAMLAGGFLLIGGPNFFEQFFGYDAGLRGGGAGALAGVQAVGMGARVGGAAVHSAAGIGKAATSIAKKAGNGGLQTGAGLSGLISGLRKNQAPSSEDSMKKGGLPGEGKENNSPSSDSLSKESDNKEMNKKDSGQNKESINRPTEEKPKGALENGKEQGKEETVSPRETNVSKPEQEGSGISREKESEGESISRLDYENQTIEDLTRNKVEDVKNKITDSDVVRKTRRTYQVGQNTGRAIRSRLERRDKNE